MKLALAVAQLLAARHGSARGPPPLNLLRNGGFEVGASAWGVKFEVWAYSVPQVDTRSSWSIVDSPTEAAQGDRALRVTLAPTPGLLARPVPGAEVMSDYFQAEANTTLTFSVAARAAAPVNATLIIRYQPVGDNLGTLNLPTLRQTVVLTPQWKRHALTTDRLPGSQNNAYAAGLQFEAEHAEVWVDAAHAGPGRGAEYSPRAAIEFAGHAGDANSLHPPGLPAPLELLLRNNRPQPATLTLSTTVLGPGYQRVLSSQRAMTVPAASTLRAAQAVTTALRGPHRVYLAASDAGTRSEVASDHFSYGVLEEAAPTTHAAGSRPSRFGVNVK